MSECNEHMRVGMLTAGGDCPGLNAVIRAATRRLLECDHEPVGLLRGYRGLLDPAQRTPLDHRAVSGILHTGGTILSISSLDPWREPDGVERVRAAQAADPLDALIAIGGEHTMKITRQIHEELGLPVVGVPKTIDNDVTGTDYTFGFDTAVQVATDAIDRLHTTAQSHDRVMVLEVMGRNSGWIAVFAGLAGGADAIVIPELELTVEEIAGAIERRHHRGKDFSIVVVAEGAELAEGALETVGSQTDEFGHARLGGIGERLAVEIEQRTGYETRSTALGHIQRGGTPTAFDRVLATRFGVAAINAAHDRRWGSMAALKGGHVDLVPLADAVASLRGTRIELVTLEEAVRELRTVPAEEYEAAAAFFG